MDPIEIKRIMREYYEQLYAIKLKSTDEMGKFVERQKLSNKYLIHLISIKEIECLI